METKNSSSINVRPVYIDLQSAALRGTLYLPDHPLGWVILIHAVGSSRDSRKIKFVSSVLNERGIATLLFDLMTLEERQDRELRLSIPFLGKRVTEVAQWLESKIPEFRHSPFLSLYGVGHGGAAALWAAAESAFPITALVTLSGRPDLVGLRLHAVTAPTLLLVGKEDSPLIDLHTRAFNRLFHADLVLIEGANQLFEDTNALREAATQAENWFAQFFHDERSSYVGMPKKTAS